ncbi:OLC1v1029256C1 [Oldenlandia corymbosa var. corymbosa]|uniref:OLC1v1029256C1 n=1 Tax=Oldenlandia corymbosa var. corymbosa TaxID=529605 RepID=A0AAV1CE39_OLDCO|nr:OLC1v1029256C1 [Oldenlandia corymbosa var. corymbosa]
MVKKILANVDDCLGINSVLKEFYSMWFSKDDFCDDDGGGCWDSLRLVMEELEILRPHFALLPALTYGADLQRAQILCSLVDFKAVLKRATLDLRRICKRGRAGGTKWRVKNLLRVVQMFQDSMPLFRPNIARAFGQISQRAESRVRWTHFCYWSQFFNPHFIDMTISFLCRRKEGLPLSLKTCLEALPKTHFSLDLFLNDVLPTSFDGNSDYCNLLNHIGALLVQAASHLYSWSVNEMDQDLVQQETVVNDLLKSLTPTTPRVLGMFIRVLRISKILKSWETIEAATHLVNFLIPAETEQILSSSAATKIFQKALIGLVSFLIDASIFSKKETDMCQEVLKETMSVVREFGSLRHLLYASDDRVSKQTRLALFNLLHKMVLLNLEVLLLELEALIEFEPQLKVQKDQESAHRFNLLQKHNAVLKIPVQDQLCVLHEGLRFLRAFLPYARQCDQLKYLKRMEALWMHIEDLTRDASLMYDSFCLASITQKVAMSEIHKLQLKVNFLNIEVFFMELLETKSSLFSHLEGKVKVFYEGLVFIRTFIMSPLDEDGILILPDIKALLIEVKSLYYSFHEPGNLLLTLECKLSSLVEMIMSVKADITERYKRIRLTSQCNFPNYSGLDFIDFILENLKELLAGKIPTIDSIMHHVEVIHNEMEDILNYFPRNVEWQHDEGSDLKSLARAIISVACQAEYVIDTFTVSGGAVWYHVLWLSDLIEELKLLKVHALEISKKTPDQADTSVKNVGQPLTNVTSVTSAPFVGEIVVDLHDQAKLIIDKLMAGSAHQDVVSIVGMPGLGKTTLAQRVYNDPSVVHHFHMRAWSCVSQNYQKRKLLLDLLSNLIELNDDIHELTDDDLDFKLYQCLKQRRYLIVFDDLWSIQPWNDLLLSLPDDNNGSRILITSRLPDVASKVAPGSVPHHLRLLSEDESWELLQKKLFQSQDCPDGLMEVGKEIVRSCKGLPLAIVAISGLLQRTEKTQDWWNQVAESLTAKIVDSAETRCMDILELSFKHLPNHLKPCFLYVGAFLADQEIPVWKLRSLWIAEGFIKKTFMKSLDDVADEYLKDLIGRSLVMASKRSSRGGVKTCRVHDLLHAMCLAKCKEDNFLLSVDGYDQHFSSSFEDLDYGVDLSYSYPASSITYKTARLSIYSKRNHFVMLRPSGEQLRSLLFFASTDTYPRCPYDISFIPLNFKLLRVLDLECINLGNSFPTNIENLVHLRFLSVCGDIDSIPASVANLCNLETLIVKGLKGKVALPNAIWSMVKLRHIHVKNYACMSWEDCCFGDFFRFPLHNLISLSNPYLYGCDTEKIMRMLPKLQKLRCVFAQSQDGTGDSNEFSGLQFLMELESLKVYYSGRIAHSRNLQLPLNLKKLTLEQFRLPWDRISEVGKLPNLEVLKLLSRSFEGKIWNMSEGEFLKLKYLKLDNVNLAQWNASSDHLPELERLVVQKCRQLEEIPSDFAAIETLEVIDIHFCRPSIQESVKTLMAEKLDFGHDDFKVFIDGSNWTFDMCP